MQSIRVTKSHFFSTIIYFIFFYSLSKKVFYNIITYCGDYMNYAIVIKNLTFQYKDKKIFNNLDIKIEQGLFTTILGAANSGKTTLYNILSRKIKITSEVKINLNHPHQIIFINSEYKNHLYKNVLEKLTFALEKINMDNEAISKKIIEIANYFQVYNLLERKISLLSKGEKILIEFISAIIKEPEIIVIDECLMYLDNINRNRIIKCLKMLNQKNKTTIINLTKNSEEIFYSDACIIIGDNKVQIDGLNEKIFNNIEFFKKANLKLPFILELSDKLKAYELIKEPIIDINAMIDVIWK